MNKDFGNIAKSATPTTQDWLDLDVWQQEDIWQNTLLKMYLDMKVFTNQYIYSSALTKQME